MSRRSVRSGNRPRVAGAEPGAGKRAGEADGEHDPFDLEAHDVGREAGGAEEESDDEVRAHGRVGREPDAAQERGHPERSEDQAHRSAEQADECARDGGGQARPAGRGRRPELEKDVEPAPEEDGRDHRQEEP